MCEAKGNKEFRTEEHQGVSKFFWPLHFSLPTIWVAGCIYEFNASFICIKLLVSNHRYSEEKIKPQLLQIYIDRTEQFSVNLRICGENNGKNEKNPNTRSKQPTTTKERNM